MYRIDRAAQEFFQGSALQPRGPRHFQQNPVEQPQYQQVMGYASGSPNPNVYGVQYAQPSSAGGREFYGVSNGGPSYFYGTR